MNKVLSIPNEEAKPGRTDALACLRLSAETYCLPSRAPVPATAYRPIAIQNTPPKSDLVAVDVRRLIMGPLHPDHYPPQTTLKLGIYPALPSRPVKPGQGSWYGNLPGSRQTRDRRVGRVEA